MPDDKDDDLEIPECLRRYPGEIRPAWKPTPAVVAAKEEWERREEVIREQKAAERKAKNARGLAKVRAKHPGERYDRKRKIWVPVEKIDALET